MAAVIGRLRLRRLAAALLLAGVAAAPAVLVAQPVPDALPGKTAPQDTGAGTPAPDERSPANGKPPSDVKSGAEAKPSADAKSGRTDLSAELMYRILVGDIALQRGEPAVAARAYYEAAKDTRDVWFARRATEVALMARQRSLAVDAARLWSELDPAAERPRQIVATVGARAAAGAAGAVGAEGADENELKVQLERALAAQAAASPAALAEAFLHLNGALAREADPGAIYRLIAALAEPYPKVAEAHYAVALAAFHTGLKDMSMRTAATRALEQALALKPGWERALLLKAEILSRESPAGAIEFLEGAVKADPSSRALAGSLAQLYVEQKRYAEARALFERMWEQDKSARELQYGAAMVAMQMKDWPGAEKLLLELQSAGYGDNGAVELYLGQVAEETGRYALAIERYKAVPEGERAWQGKLRVATVLAKQKKLDEARAYLRELPAVTIDERIQVRQTEAQLLRDAGDQASALSVLNAGLEDFPDNPDLLYDGAMVAERLGQIDVAEAKLRRVLELAPDNAQALNALGYTLVDRTTRIQEGYALIEKAHALSPSDPFILDSMGWALFRLGKLDAAEEYLRRALRERPDAEIAAHLGEVLWAKGDRAAAREVWQSQLKDNPDHPVLLETVRRLSP